MASQAIPQQVRGTSGGCARLRHVAAASLSPGVWALDCGEGQGRPLAGSVIRQRTPPGRSGAGAPHPLSRSARPLHRSDRMQAGMSSQGRSSSAGPSCLRRDAAAGAVPPGIRAHPSESTAAQVPGQGRIQPRLRLEVWPVSGAPSQPLSSSAGANSSRTRGGPGIALRQHPVRSPKSAWRRCRRIQLRRAAR